MKVYIGPWEQWFRPATWYANFRLWCSGKKRNPLEDEEESWLDTQLWKIESWANNRFERKVRIEVHDYDVWSMAHTLALITLPLLQRLKQKKPGIPYVYDVDVPEELRSTVACPATEEQHLTGCDSSAEARWEWVLQEIMWAFEQKLINDDFMFFDGDRFDVVGYTAWQERKARGFALFGKYFEEFWD